MTEKIMETEAVEKFREGETVTDSSCQQKSLNPPKRFRCELCERSYAGRCHLNRHYKRNHKRFYSSMGKMKCPFPSCDFSCMLLKDLRIHLNKADTHNVAFQCYKKTFKSVEDFMEWKAAEEQKTKMVFLRACRTRPLPSGVIPMYFRCHRSGYAKCNEKVNGKDRAAKKTKKMNATCPAAMNVNVVEGKVNLIYHKTHVGHGDEWQYQRLSRTERDYIASKLSQGFSFDKILEDIKNDDTFADQRIKMVTRKDLRNIMKAYGVQWNEEEVYNDLKNTDTWVRQLKEFSFSPVLFYKPCGISMSNRNSYFYKRDFMLTIMTEGQRQMLEMLPTAVVGIYCSLESNSHNLFLITFFVIDESGLPFPVAYCLTSRTDDVAVKTFLNSLKDKLGAISAALFISDDSCVYHSAWTEVMGAPVKRIMYFPHMKHSWKKNLCKISGDNEKQETVYNSLVNLSMESDCSRFEHLLTSFVDQIEHDDDLKEFVTYFKNDFLSRTDMWALCRYADAGLPTIAYLEVMHQRVCDTCFYEGTPKSVDLCIRELLLLTHKYFYEHLSKIYRETDFIERAITLNHTNNEQLQLIEIECIELSAKWKIRTNDDDSVYCVKKRDSNCEEKMLLQCPLCQVFLDDYTCNCVDYLIMCTICEHVHAITRLSKDFDITTENTIVVAQLSETSCEIVSCEETDCAVGTMEGDELKTTDKTK